VTVQTVQTIKITVLMQHLSSVCHVIHCYNAEIS